MPGLFRNARIVRLVNFCPQRQGRLLQESLLCLSVCHIRIFEVPQEIRTINLTNMVWLLVWQSWLLLWQSKSYSTTPSTVLSRRDRWGLYAKHIRSSFIHALFFYHSKTPDRQIGHNKSKRICVHQTYHQETQTKGEVYFIYYYQGRPSIMRRRRPQSKQSITLVAWERSVWLLKPCRGGWNRRPPQHQKCWSLQFLMGLDSIWSNFSMVAR